MTNRVADETRSELFALIEAAKPTSYSGDGFWIGDAVDAILANPEVVLRALGGRLNTTMHEYDRDGKPWLNWSIPKEPS